MLEKLNQIEESGRTAREGFSVRMDDLSQRVARLHGIGLLPAGRLCCDHHFRCHRRFAAGLYRRRPGGRHILRVAYAGRLIGRSLLVQGPLRTCQALRRLAGWRRPVQQLAGSNHGRQGQGQHGHSNSGPLMSQRKPPPPVPGLLRGPAGFPPASRPPPGPIASRTP